MTWCSRFARAARMLPWRSESFKGLGATLVCFFDALEHADCLGGGQRHVRGEVHVVVRIEGDQWV